MKKILRASAFAAVAFAAFAAQASTIVWDQGPSTGTYAGEYGNQTGVQQFVDTVSFSTATTVSGYNYFTDFNLSGDTSSTAFHLQILADVGGQPGAVLYSADIGFDSYGTTGQFNELHFDFSPQQFAAGQTFWIGLSGNGFEAAQPTVNAPQDGNVGYFEGSTYEGLAAVGDQMFQLTGVSAVPETGTVALMGAGLALLGLMARRNRA